MLTHSIEIYSPPSAQVRHYAPVPRGTWKGREGTFDHRKFIFERAQKLAHSFEEGDDCIYKRQHATILKILSKMTDEGVVWDGLRACFMEIWLHGTDIFLMVHPSDIKKPRK